MNLDQTKKFILMGVVLVELVIGFLFLFRFYQKEIIHQTQDADKIAVIKKENLVFPKESEFKSYYELKANTLEIASTDWLKREVTYTYNADGLNERFNYEIEKPANTFRIITLGDSFTFGHYVNTDENWTEKLEDMLNRSGQQICDYKKVEVINLGMAGWDIPYIVKRYQDLGAKYQPDLIIWFESGSGFTRLNELYSPIINTCAAACTTKITTPMTDKEKTYLCHLDCWKQAEQEINDKYSYEDISALISGYLDSFFNHLRGEKVLFFTFEVSALNDQWLATLQTWRNKYPDATFSSTIPYLFNLGQVLPDGHPSVKGHQVIATTIFEYLKAAIFNQCAPLE